MKKFFVFLMATAIAFSMTGCGILLGSMLISSGDSDDTKTVSNVQKPEENKNDSAQKEEESKEESATAKVGGTVEGSKWKISLTSAKTYEQIEGQFSTEKPAEGKIYLVCFFEVENVSNEDDYFNHLNFESYVDGYNQSKEVLMADIGDFSTLTGDVAAGKKLKGYLAWEVSPDWKELEVSYKDDYFSGKKDATFVVTPDQLSE